MFRRKAARRVAWRAHRRLGVPLRLAFYIAFACRRERLPYAIGYAVCEQESNFRNVYGHDAGGLFPGEEVTRANYRKLRKHLQATQGPGANGVGPFQITYYTYILENPGLWKQRANTYKGIEILADYIGALGRHAGIGAYNGGPTNPIESYAREVEERIARIRPRLTKENR